MRSSLSNRILVFLALSFAFTVCPVNAQGLQRITEMVQQARQSEAQRDYSSAGMQYYSILENDILERNASVPISLKSALGRRAIACLTIAARQDMERVSSDEGWAHSENLNMLEKMWQIMQSVEPSNPTWLYLRATRSCSQGRYHDARVMLQHSLRCSGGQATVKQKAKMLLAHIDKFATQDLAKLNKQDAYSLQLLMSGQLNLSAGASSSSTSSSGDSGWKPDELSDSERRARDAESRGDSGAAARFRSGGTTVEDHSKYW